MSHLGKDKVIPWSLTDILFYCLSLIFLFFFIGSIVSVLAHYQILPQINDPALKVFLLFLLQSVVFFIPLLIIASRKKLRSLRDAFGLRTVSLFQLTVYPLLGVISGIFTLMIFQASMRLSGVSEITGFSGEQEALTDIFGTSHLSLVLAFFAAVLLAPVVEECIFRGFILRGVLKRSTPVTAVIFSSVLFSLIHVTQLNLVVPIFTLGIIMGSIYIKSGSIYPTIVFHIVNNFLAFSAEISTLGS